MKLRNATILALAMILMAGVAVADGVVGKWEGETDTGPLTVIITETDGKLGGTIESVAGITDLSDVAFADDEVSFIVNIEIGGQAITLKFVGAIDGQPGACVAIEVNKLQLEVDVGGVHRRSVLNLDARPARRDRDATYHHAARACDDDRPLHDDFARAPAFDRDRPGDRHILGVRAHRYGDDSAIGCAIDRRLNFGKRLGRASV